MFLKRWFRWNFSISKGNLTPGSGLGSVFWVRIRIPKDSNEYGSLRKQRSANPTTRPMTILIQTKPETGGVCGPVHLVGSLRLSQRVLWAVLRIHDNLGWIRIRGSIHLTNGSGCGSCYFRHWPSQNANKKLIFKKSFFPFYFLKVHVHHFQSQKEVTKQ